MTNFQKSEHKIHSVIKLHGTKFKPFLIPDDYEGTLGIFITTGSSMSVSIIIILWMCENTYYNFIGCRKLQYLVLTKTVNILEIVGKITEWCYQI